MAGQGARNLVPDNYLLAEIFPSIRSVQFDVIRNNFQSCTIMAHYEDSNEKVVVRIEPEGSQICAASAIQKLAARALPDLVPHVYQTGTASKDEGQRLDYLVTAYVNHAVTLDSIWDDLAEHQQAHLVRQITYAVEKLQSINLLSDQAQQILRSEIHALPEDSAIPLGGPRMGFFSNAADMVRALVSYEDWLDLVTISDTDDGGLKFGTAFSDGPSVSIPKESLLALQEAVVLCHNDLEPRNILFRAEEHMPNINKEAVRYRVVAIIDWDKPASFLSHSSPSTRT